MPDRPSGGAPCVGNSLLFDLDVLAAGGTVVVTGDPRDEVALTCLWHEVRPDTTVRSFAMSNEPDLGRVLDDVADLLATGRLKEHVARRYDLEEAPEAQRAVIEDSFHEKLVILPSLALVRPTPRGRGVGADAGQPS